MFLLIIGVMPYPLLLLFWLGDYTDGSFQEGTCDIVGENLWGGQMGERELVFSQQAQFKTIMVIKTLCLLVN